MVLRNSSVLTALGEDTEKKCLQLLTIVFGRRDAGDLEQTLSNLLTTLKAKIDGIN